MPFIHRRPSWLLRGLRETSETDFHGWHRFGRRELLRSIAGAAVAGGLASWSDEAAGSQARGQPADSPYFPAKRNESFTLDRPLTDELAAARYNNFYEFSEGKRVAPMVRHWDISDWKVEIGGLVDNPTTFDMDTIAKTFPYEERLYRFRCVETWAMAVPWTGFPLRLLLAHAEPRSSARFVKFISFDHTKARGTRSGRRGEPWPYTEALTIEEAANDLAFVATGIYGHELPKQHGAPIRMALPWKYGFKGAKSLVRIELVSTIPATFWPTINSNEYDFVANVDPRIPHPRWSQAMEWDVGTRRRVPTLVYNGYGALVASLYA